MDYAKTKREISHLHLILVVCFLAFLLQFPRVLESVNVYNDHILAGQKIGSYIGYITSHGRFLDSANGTFSLVINATYNTADIQGGSYYLSIVHRSSKVIVWVANRESPGNSSDILVFSKTGNLRFGSIYNELWSSNTKKVSMMRLLDTGNLVMLDAKNKTVWQSFDHPSDTLLQGQVIGLKPSQKLVSSISATNMSSGPYSLSFNSAKGDLQLLFSGLGDPLQPYWSMKNDSNNVFTNSSSTSPAYAVLNWSSLCLLSKDGNRISEIRFTPGKLARATLGSDGNLQIYVFSYDQWISSQFQSHPKKCQLPFYCGYSNICTGDNAQCTCPAKLKYMDNTNPNGGCTGSTLAPCVKSKSSPSPSAQSSVINEISTDIDYFATKFTSPSNATDFDSCKKLCLSNCSCIYGLFYKKAGHCFLFPKLGTLTKSSPASAEGTLFVKSHKERQNLLIPVIIVGVVFVIILALLGCLAYWFVKRWKQMDDPDQSDVDDSPFFENIPGLPTRFSYQDLQIATDNFSRKLGEGGFGSVYEGELPDKTKVAVKQLENVGQGKLEFRSEVTIIGSINHVHLVRLCGFCSDGLHRLLVYEFMSNGSLDKCLFAEEDSKHVLDWNTRFRIALGTAKGLAYLHGECREKVIHCDIKPENILLDENFNAKVSDFGLAKLLSKEQSQVFTTMRGTRGYLAPEWLMNLPISEKSDVYSYGMVLLELISGRKNYNPSVPAERRYIPSYAFQQLMKGPLEEVLDERLRGMANNDEVIKMVKVALWCIQDDSFLRPSMTKVVQMLKGESKIDEPPVSRMVVGFNAPIVDTLSSSSHATTIISESSNQLPHSGIDPGGIQCG